VRAGLTWELPMKANYKRSLPKSHGVAGLPLFDWRQTPPRRPPTQAGAYVTRKFGGPTAIADVVAALAGLGPRETGR
jgi:hypothetical protein